MTVRTLNRIVIAGLSLVVIAFLALAVGGLFERPFRLAPYLAHLAPLIIFPMMLPQWLKTMRERAETYGPEGRLPERQTLIMTLALGVGGAALLAGFALAVYFGYTDARHSL